MFLDYFLVQTKETVQRKTAAQQAKKVRKGKGNLHPMLQLEGRVSLLSSRLSRPAEDRNGMPCLSVMECNKR